MQTPGAGPSSSLRRTTRTTRSTTSNANTAAITSIAGPVAAAAAASLKKRTRSTSADVDRAGPILPNSKKPALSDAFANQMSQSALNRKLLNAQSQVTELQNKLLEKQGLLDRLEADHRLLATQEEKERERRITFQNQLEQDTKRYESEISLLQRTKIELESAHDELQVEFSSLSRSTQSEIAQLKSDVSIRDRRIELLERQLEEVEERAREKEEMARNLEEEVYLYRNGEIDPQMELELELEDDFEDEHEREREREEEENGVSGERNDDSDSDAEEEDDQEEKDNDREDVKEFVGFERGSSELREKDELEGDDNVVEEDDSQDADAEVDMSFTADNVPHIIERSSHPPADPPHTPTIRQSQSHPPSLSPVKDRSPTNSVSISTSVSERTSPYSKAKRHDQRRGSNIGNNSRLSREHRLSLLRRPRTSSISTTNSSSYNLSFAARNRASASAQAQAQFTADRTTLREELTRVMKHLTQLEAANLRLTTELSKATQRVESMEVLREQKRELEKKVEVLEELRRKVAELEIELGEVRERERKREGDVQSTPVGIAHQLTSERTNYALLLEEHGTLKADLRSKEVELASVKSQFDATEIKLRQVQDHFDEVKESLVRRDKDLELCQREVVFLRSLVSSYKEEDSIMHQTDDEEKGVSSIVKLEQQIEHLETLLTEYKERNFTLEQELDKVVRSGGPSAGRKQEHWDQLVRRLQETTSSAKRLESDLNEATKSIEVNEKQIDSLEQELFELRGEIGGGRHVPPGTRILSLADNPAKAWADTRQAVLDRLKGENDALLKRLSELEERIGASSSSTVGSESDGRTLTTTITIPRESWESIQQEKIELQESLKQKEKRLLRLQQIFTAKSTEFREAISAIMGVKLAFYPNGQVRVTSIYDLSASFVFQPLKDSGDTGGGTRESKGKDGLGYGEGVKMQLIGTGENGPDDLESLVELWIEREQCIPCFLASITIEAYDKIRRKRDGF